MLQQILNDMFIDPELLMELDEEQKQLLFCKMREEQVRKWREREKLPVDQSPSNRVQNGKKVSFLVGGEGEPLVVVLGEDEHVDIVLQERARLQAEIEETAIRKAAEEELDNLVKFSQSTVRAMEESACDGKATKTLSDSTQHDVKQSVDEETSEMEDKIWSLDVKEQIEETSFPECSPIEFNTEVNSFDKSAIVVQPYESQSTQKVPFGVAAQIRQYEQMSEDSIKALKIASLEKAKERRQNEILDTLRNQVEAAKKQISNPTPIVTEREETVWREQERKAKEAEKNIREIARRARFEHRRSSSSSSITDVANEDINGNLNMENDDKNNDNANLQSRLSSEVHPKLRAVRPSNRDSIIEWFREEELPKGVGLNDQKTLMQPWFHGVISRLEAERLLERAELGSFLVRVSERIWGYAVSYRAPDRCRHYLIDAVVGKYAFLGSHQTTHPTLNALIEYHNKECITMSGDEILNNPCRQDDPKRPDYLELLIGTKYFTLIQCAM